MSAYMGDSFSARQLPTAPYEVRHIEFMPIESGTILTTTKILESQHHQQLESTELSLKRGKCRKVLTRTGTVINVNGSRVEIGIYEMSGDKQQNRSKSTLSGKFDCTHAQTPVSCQKLSKPFHKLERLICTKIACQRPKEKDYRNLPETAVAGVSVDNGEADVERWYTRTTLIKMWGRERVDGFLIPVMLRSRPRWREYSCFGTTFISNNMHVTSGDLSPSAIAGLEGTNDRAEPNDGGNVRSSGVDDEGTTLGPSILDLPDELLLQIVDDVVEDAAPLKQLVYTPYTPHGRRSPVGEVINPIPIFAVNHTLRSIAYSLNREVALSSTDWKGTDYHNVLATESYALLQCASRVRVELRYLPKNTRHPIIPQLAKILQTNPILTEIVFELKRCFRYWPHGCSEGVLEDVRKIFLKDLFQPLEAVLKRKDGKILYYIGDDSSMLSLDDGWPFGPLSPLQWACQRGSLAVVQYLLETVDTDTNEDHEHWGRPLSIAAGDGFDGIVRFLLESDEVDINARGGIHNHTALLHAAYRGQTAVVKILLEHADIDPEVRDICGRTALAIAVRESHEEIVQALCQYGVETNSVDDDGHTPLIIAASKLSGTSMVEALLRVISTDPNMKDKTGWSALWIAAENGCQQIVARLCANGRVDVNSPDSQGDTALHVASRKGNLSAVDALLLSGRVHVNEKGWRGRTPLFDASASGEEAICRRLLCEKNIDISIIDDSSDCAITIASSRRGSIFTRTSPDAELTDVHANIVRCLLGHASLDSQHALWRATICRDAWLIQLLLQQGNVDASKGGPDGKSPVQWAKSNGDEHIINLLHPIGGARRGSSSTFDGGVEATISIDPYATVSN